MKGGGFGNPFTLERSLLLSASDYSSGQYSALLRRLFDQNPSLVGVKYRDGLSHWFSRDVTGNKGQRGFIRHFIRLRRNFGLFGIT
jgi:hypothetical protein